MRSIYVITMTDAHGFSVLSGVAHCSLEKAKRFCMKRNDYIKSESEFVHIGSIYRYEITEITLCSDEIEV